MLAVEKYVVRLKPLDRTLQAGVMYQAPRLTAEVGRHAEAIMKSFGYQVITILGWSEGRCDLKWLKGFLVHQALANASGRSRRGGNHGIPRRPGL
jgi:hypothetical protein